MTTGVAATHPPRLSSSTGGPNFGACNLHGDCILQSPGCCSPCQTLTLDLVEPINRNQSSAFRDATCDSPDAPCPACEPIPNGNLFAYCEAGQCQEADVETADWNTCNDNSDCRLRAGAGAVSRAPR